MGIGNILGVKPLFGWLAADLNDARVVQSVRTLAPEGFPADTWRKGRRAQRPAASAGL